MSDYQEYRSYGSYISRVFAIVIAFILLVLAIWFVVKIAGDNEPILGDTTTADLDRSSLGQNNDSDFTVNLDSDNSSEQGHTLSTNTDTDLNQNGAVAGVTTDGLPNTGANFTSIFMVGGIVYLVSKFSLKDGYLKR